MSKILFVAPHRPDRSPSQRYRIEQFLAYWSSKGYTHEYAWLINALDDAYFYAPGNFIAKGLIFIKSWLKRQYHLRQAHKFDIVFVQREAFMTGSTRFERGFKKTGARLIFTFIYFPVQSTLFFQNEEKAICCMLKGSQYEAP